jgi:hypothetical protein
MRNLLLAAIVLLVGSSPAFAHRLNVRAKLVVDQIRVEAFYDDDTPSQDAKITIALGDQTVAEGRTDEKGIWTCARLAPGKYMVRAESVGHTAKEPLEVAEGEQVSVADSTKPDDERARLTQTPWGRLAAGLAVIGGLWVAWIISRRAVTKTGHN